MIATKAQEKEHRQNRGTDERALGSAYHQQ
jgi:hypothetical protein